MAKCTKLYTIETKDETIHLLLEVIDGFPYFVSITTDKRTGGVSREQQGVAARYLEELGIEVI